MQNDYQFEPVHIDWSGLRTQMIIGLLAIFCLCLVNFIPFWQLKNFDLADLFFDFTLYFASCSLVALITLAIGKSAGNRNGAACAIWAALIFAVHPWQIFCIGKLTARLMVFLMLLLFFFLLHHKQGKGLGLLVSVILIVFCLLFNSCWMEMSTSFFGTGYDVTPLKQLVLVVPGYILIGLILLGRSIAGIISWHTVGKIVSCLMVAFIFIQSGSGFESFSLLGVAGLGIALSLACLPTLGAASARANAVYGSLGLIALSLLSIAYEYQ